MKYAVVPVTPDSDGNLSLSDEHVGIVSAYACDGPEHAFLLYDGGKLTKEQVEAMARAFIETMLDPLNENNPMIAALETVGIEVE